MWLGDGCSTLDLYGRGFVLIRLGTDAPEVFELESAAEVRRVPFKTVTVTQPEATQLYERRLILVRPDGHVAWRADEVPLDAGVIDKVRGVAG